MLAARPTKSILGWPWEGVPPRVLPTGRTLQYICEYHVYSCIASYFVPLSPYNLDSRSFGVGNIFRRHVCFIPCSFDGAVVVFCLSTFLRYLLCSYQYAFQEYFRCVLEPF
jgi:hypothetical protein